MKNKKINCKRGANRMRKNKTIIWLLLAVVMLALVGCGNSSRTSTRRHSESINNNSGNTQNGTESNSDKKTLIVYYSYSGTTQRVAEHLQKLTNADIYELELKNPYTGDSNEVSDRVFEERGDGKMPELSGELPDLSEYDRILIGTPVWNDDMSNPVASYLEQTDFGGKTVAPFWTYITNQGSTSKNFVKRCQNAEMADGLAISSANGLSDNKLDKKLNDWLQQEVEK